MFNLKKMQNFLYKDWGKKGYFFALIFGALLIALSEFSEKLAMGIIILVVIVLGILVWITPKPIDYDSDW